MSFVKKISHFSKKTMYKCLSLLTGTAIVLALLPITASASAEPIFSGETNAAGFMRVTVGNDDVTDSFKESGNISVKENTRGNFTNIFFTGNTYYYSASVKIENDTSTYGSIRLVAGTCKMDGSIGYLEVCARPNIGGQTVYFINANGETAVEVGNNVSVNIGDTARYTVKYENREISLWINGTQIFESVKLPAKAKNVQPAPGFYSQNCSGTISDIKIWGELEQKVCPAFNENTDSNLIYGVSVKNNCTGEVLKPSDCRIASEVLATVRNTFGGIEYDDNTYSLSTDAVLNDNPNVDYEGLIFKVATAKKDGADCDIEIRVRRNMIVLFAVNSTAENPIEINYGYQTVLGTKNSYAINFRKSGLIDFWKDGNAVFYRFDLTAYGFEEILPSVSLGGEMSGYEFSNIKLWGDGLRVDSEPEFDENNDTNAILSTVISNPLTDEAIRGTDCSTKSEKTDTCRLQLLGPEYLGAYSFTADALMYDNKNIAPWGIEYNFEGLIFTIGKTVKNESDCTVELRVRSNGIFIFLVKSDGEDVIYSDYGTLTEFGKKNRYTLDYKTDGTFDFWIDGLRVIHNFNVQSNGCKVITPELGIGGEVCAFEFENIHLWGNIYVHKAPEFDPDKDTDIIGKAVVNDIFSGELYKLTSGKFANKTNMTGRVDFTGIKFDGDYAFYTNAMFYDNKNKTDAGNEIDWEGIIFRIAEMSNDGKKYTLEYRIRRSYALIYSVDGSGAEQLIEAIPLSTPYGSENSYVVDFKNKKADLWKNGVRVITAFDPTEHGYSDISPIMGLGGEVCSFKFSDMHLVNIGATYTAEVPAMPKGNGDYVTVAGVNTSNIVTYENGTLKCTDDSISPKATFKYLPFTAKDTYLFGADIKVTKSERIWMGPRFVIGKNQKDEDIAVFFTQTAIMVADGNEVSTVLEFTRKQNKNYRWDMLIEPGCVSVWINGILVIDKAKTAEKAKAELSVLFENCEAELKNVNIYHTYPAKFIVPVKPKKPVYKEIADGQYNAAEFGSVLLNGSEYGGYFGCKLASTDSKSGLRYVFDNLPVSDSSEYYFSSEFTVTESDVVWKGPRFIFRSNDDTVMYCTVTHTAIIIMAGAKQVESYPFNLELGKRYKINILSSPDKVSVWLDKQLIFENVDIADYAGNGFKAIPGVLFELCRATVSNICVYGDSVVFNPDYVDMDLYNDAIYRMSGIPKNTSGEKNLFMGTYMNDGSQGSLGAVYDRELLSFKNEFGDVKDGIVSFVDTDGSSNINGLKNESGYVFRFKYKAESATVKEDEESGVWFVCNKSTAPWLTENCNVMLGIFSDSIRLKAYKDGICVSEQKNDFNRVLGKEYDVAVVHGKNWVKLFIDGETMLVGTGLPTYNVAFDFNICNTASVMSNFELYETKSSGLDVKTPTDDSSPSKSGNTVVRTEASVIKAERSFPIAVICVLGALIISSGAFGVYLIYRRRKQNGK